MNTYYDVDYVTAVPQWMLMAVTLLCTVLGIILAVMVISHIIDAIALMKLGKRLNVKNSFFAWFPIGDMYVVGALASEIDREKGRNRKFGAMLPVLSALSLPVVPLFLKYMEILTESESTPLEGGGYISLIVIFLVLIVASLAASLLSIFNTICIFKIFEYLNPKKAVKYFVLSIIVPLADGILLLKCEKNFKREEALEVEE